MSAQIFRKDNQVYDLQVILTNMSVLDSQGIQTTTENPITIIRNLIEAANFVNVSNTSIEC